MIIFRAISTSYFDTFCSQCDFLCHTVTHSSTVWHKVLHCATQCYTIIHSVKQWQTVSVCDDVWHFMTNHVTRRQTVMDFDTECQKVAHSISLWHTISNCSTQCYTVTYNVTPWHKLSHCDTFSHKDNNLTVTLHWHCHTLTFCYTVKFCYKVKHFHSAKQNVKILHYTTLSTMVPHFVKMIDIIAYLPHCISWCRNIKRCHTLRRTYYVILCKIVPYCAKLWQVPRSVTLRHAA